MIYILEDNEVMAECIAEAVYRADAPNASGGGEMVEEKSTRIDSGGDWGGSVEEGVMAAGESATSLASGVGRKVRIFSDALEAIRSLDDDELPRLIFLDILLTGPDGFTFLNELASYRDTAEIPVVIVSTLDFTGRDLSAYGVVGVLDKETMTPADIEEYVRRYAGDGR